MERAFEDLKRYKPGRVNDFYMGSKAQFMSSAFHRPVSVERVKVLASRTYTEMKGITEAMSQQMSRVLVDGLIAGQSPREVAKALNERVDAIGKARAFTLARTEIIRAHANGALDGLEELGVTEVGVAVEWSTAKDGRVCPMCAAMQGVVFTIEEARGLIPAHAGCRCSPIPANVGEPTKGQIRTKGRIEQAIRKALNKDVNEDWAGANVTITKSRPESVF